MNRLGNILWGLVFIVIGLIWAGNALGIMDVNIFFSGWWTLIIIIPCFIGLVKRQNITGNIIGIIIGVLLLLCAQGLLSFSLIIKLMVPLVLVLIGLSMIFNDAIHRTINKKIKSLNKEGLEEYCATFGEQKVDLRGEEFKGASLSAVFGSVQLNMRDCIMNNEQIINASAIFGGVEITVPNNVNVKVKSTPIFGGVSNKSTFVKGENIPTIYINAFCLFGGVEIR